MPYSSEAQRKYFNANREKLEAEGVDVDEWNQSTKGKKLPLKAKKEEPKSKLSKNAQNIPLDLDLYQKAKDIVYKQYPQHSAYRSGMLVKKYKDMGGTYSGKKTKKGLTRWFKEEWKNIDPEAKDESYPVYRPTKRVSKETPLLMSEIDPEDLKEKIKQKQLIRGTANLKPFRKKGTQDDTSVSFLPDYTPEQLKEMGVYKEVYGTKDAPRLASLPEWPAHWYNEADPHGWLQWYDRHSKGRRIEDDKRQIKRWISFKARHGGKAFRENPTPRRAFALRNWGIDPTKLVDDPEALKAVMDEYKEKQYSKKMEKLSFLPKSAKDGSNLKPNSFLPKTGAIMTPTSRRSADAFYNLADNVSQKKYDPMKGLDTYIQDGSNLMSEKLMGKKMSPVDIVKLVRKSGLASAITGDFDLMKWDPKSQAHYDAFSSGPVSAYSQFLKEKNIDNDSVWRDSSEKLTPSLSDKMAPGFAISKATGRAPWGYAARVRDTASRGADLYEPVGRQTYRDPIKRDMLTDDSMDKVWQTATSLSSPLNPGKTMTDINNELSKYVGTSDHNSIPTEGQTRMYPKFDNYLKWRNPNLHSKKQIIDFDNGMIRVPDAVTSYKPLISAVSFLDDTLYPANQNMIAKQ